ncbi:hypothetical protein D9M68_825360 [compost metagenome]
MSPFFTVTKRAGATAGAVTVIRSSTSPTPSTLPRARRIFSFSSWVATSPLTTTLSPSTDTWMAGLPRPTLATCSFSDSAAWAS